MKLRIAKKILFCNLGWYYHSTHQQDTAARVIMRAARRMNSRLLRNTLFDWND